MCECRIVNAEINKHGVSATCADCGKAQMLDVEILKTLELIGEYLRK